MKEYVKIYDTFRITLIKRIKNKEIIRCYHKSTFVYF